MIRDRIVVGIQDIVLPEKLQLKSNLTLETAVTAVRQIEVVKKQQITLRGQPASSLYTSVDAAKATTYKTSSSNKETKTDFQSRNRACKRESMWQMSESMWQMW